MWLATLVTAGLATWAGSAVVGLVDSRIGTSAEIADAIASREPLVVLDVRHYPTPRAGLAFPPGVDLAALDAASGEFGKVEPKLDPRLGAVDVHAGGWELTMVGTRNDPVEIVDMVTELDGACGAPLAGVFVPVRPTGGEVEKIGLRVVVDDPVPVLTASLSEPRPAGPYFGRHKIRLPKGEKTSVAIEAVAERQYCRWRIRIEFLTGTARRSLVVSAPGGRPFEATAPAEAYPYRYVNRFDPLLGCFGGTVRGRPVRVTGADYAARKDAGQACPSPT